MRTIFYLLVVPALLTPPGVCACHVGSCADGADELAGCACQTDASGTVAHLHAAHAHPEDAAADHDSDGPRHLHAPGCPAVRAADRHPGTSGAGVDLKPRADSCTAAAESTPPLPLAEGSGRAVAVPRSLPGSRPLFLTFRTLLI